MKPILPREMLWTDKKTMDEFFELEQLNEDFFEVFVTLREEPFAVTQDAVKVFNEVYYQITRMVYERPLPTDLDRYIADIKANLGWSYSAELVMSMAYYLFSLIEKQARPLNKFFTKSINERFIGCLYWKPFKHLFEKLKKEKRNAKYMFRPNPVDVDWLTDKYIHWGIITNNYDFYCIQDVVELWHSVKDRRVVANLINESINTTTFKGKGSLDVNRLKRLMNTYLMADDDSPIWMSGEESLTYNSDALNNRIEELEKDKMVLQGRIQELEAESARLNALLEKKKRNGTARKFTLVQIVDYCKGCVEWNDVKSIVAMLNKLLRRIGTEEDSNLVDSVETEFRRRILGPVTMNNPQFSGPMYGITGNQSVNIGGAENGKQGN